MSGGGIRSNAYHLGILSGLHSGKIGTTSALDRVDYLSSVSGGSWANLGLWAWPGSDDALFTCLNDAAIKGKARASHVSVECEAAVKLLRTAQPLTIISSPGHQRKREWKKAIESAMVPDPHCNTRLDGPIATNCQERFNARPYPIINSTNDAKSEHASETNYPFQTTPDGLAAIVDKKSMFANGAIGTKGSVGFYMPWKSRNTSWKWSKWLQKWTPGGRSGLQAGSELSLAAAHSSGVLRGLRAEALSYYFNIIGPDVDRLGLRDRYKLSDGGKSDNTGVIPMLERKVDILVVSHMGKDDPDGQDAKLFADLRMARSQGTRLLGCTFADLDTSPTHPLAQRSSYSCGSGSPSNVVLQVHPWHKNVESFRTYLNDLAGREPDVAEVVHYLSVEENGEGPKAKGKKPELDRFPQSKTMEMRYDEPLIRAYFLLGQYVAATQIAPFLREELDNR